MDTAGPRAVASTIAGEIRRLGPMRFDRYMELALYSPGGYYDEPPVGADPAMDFVTSPHVHPVFAQLVAEAVRDVHRAMGAPDPFDLIEGGAGDGTLLRGVVPKISDLGAETFAVERSPGALERLATMDGTTVLRGSVVDQAALHGLLQKLRDVGIPLISLRQVPPDHAPEGN